MMKLYQEDLRMPTPHDPEAHAEMETVFDCCGKMRIVFHEDLAQQFQDGVNNARRSSAGPNHKEFWLTASDEDHLLDISVSWNPSPDNNAVGSVTIDVKPQGNCNARNIGTPDTELLPPD